MASIKIPCLVGRTNAAGVTSWYWQPSKTLREAGWEPLTLGKNRAVAMEAAEKRNAEVARWKAGGTIALTKVKPKEVQGTLGALIKRYRREKLEGTKPGSKAMMIREKTRGVYETSLKRLDAWAGDQPLAFITPARIGVLRDKNVRPPEEGGIGHAATFNMLRQLRQLFAFAESVDLWPKGANPASDFGLGKPPPRKTIWTLEDDAAFDAAAYDMGWPSMALARQLALYTAQREADLIAFTEPQLQPLEILEPVLAERLAADDGKVWGWMVTQGKTSTDYVDVSLEIPLEPELLEKVRAAIRANRARDRAAEPPRLLSHVLVDDRTGLPWKQRAFIAAWRDVLEHAAKATGRDRMRELVWHDLRRTRVVRLRRRGMPKEMIAAVTGHSLRSIEEMLRVYGPVDPTITASAIVASLPPREKPKADGEAREASND